MKQSIRYTAVLAPGNGASSPQYPTIRGRSCAALMLAAEARADGRVVSSIMATVDERTVTIYRQGRWRVSNPRKPKQLQALKD